MRYRYEVRLWVTDHENNASDFSCEFLVSTPLSADHVLALALFAGRYASVRCALVRDYQAGSWHMWYIRHGGELAKPSFQEGA